MTKSRNWSEIHILNCIVVIVLNRLVGPVACLSAPCPILDPVLAIGRLLRHRDYSGHYTELDVGEDISVANKTTTQITHLTDL